MPGMEVVGVRSLRPGGGAPARRRAARRAAGRAAGQRPRCCPGAASSGSTTSTSPTCSGMADARYALEVAAAGGHHLMLSGPKGAGQDHAGRADPRAAARPDRSRSRWSSPRSTRWPGGLPPGQTMITRPPFRAPHHSASRASLLGGGTGRVRPGEVSRAHPGTLFLDEFPLFSADIVEALRQPLESGEVTIARGEESATFPARAMVVIACNPCPCGDYHPTDRDNRCTCTEVRRRDYRKKLSGPVDRPDRHRPARRAGARPRGPRPARPPGVHRAPCGPGSTAARERQAERYAGTPLAAQRRRARARCCCSAGRSTDGGAGAARGPRCTPGRSPAGGRPGCTGWPGRSPTCAGCDAPGRRRARHGAAAAHRGAALLSWRPSAGRPGGAPVSAGRTQRPAGPGRAEPARASRATRGSPRSVRRARGGRGSTTCCATSGTPRAWRTDVAARGCAASTRRATSSDAAAPGHPVRLPRATRSGRERLDDLDRCRRRSTAAAARRSGSGCGAPARLDRAVAGGRWRWSAPARRRPTAPTWPASSRPHLAGAGVDGGLRRGVRHRPGGPPRRAGGPRAHGRGAGLRRRPGLPRARTGTCSTYIAETGVVVSRAAARLRADQAALPGPQPADRRAVAAAPSWSRPPCAAARSTPPTGPALLNRVVMGVPGPVTSAPSEGVHELLRTPGRRAGHPRRSDVLELVSPGRGAHLQPPRRAAERPEDRLRETDRQVLDARPGRPRRAAPSSVARTAGLRRADRAAALGRLRAGGLVEAAQRWRLAAREHGRADCSAPGRPACRGAGVPVRRP